MNFDVLSQFNIEIVQSSNSFEKIRVSSNNLVGLLNFLKKNPEFDFNRLNSIIAVDFGIEINRFELIYDLNSINTGEVLRVSVLLDRNAPIIPSVVEVFKSAYFDECEIYDLFGIKFDKNPDLKRLLMSKGWIGHPLRKDYKQDDERLIWNN